MSNLLNVPIGEPSIVAVCTIFPVLASVTVVLRFSTRRWYRIPVKADDWLMVPALLFTYGVCACGIIEAVYGAGTPGWHLTPTLEAVSNKASYARALLYTCAAPLIKLSLILFYLRLFSPARAFRYFSYSIATVLFCWWIAFLLAAVLQCRLSTINWSSPYDGPCIDIYALYISFIVTNVLTDLVVFIMPLPMVLKLKLSRRKKVQLIGIFMIGGFACVDAIVHFGFIAAESPSAIDLSYFQAWLAIWQVMELSSGIMSGCLVTLAPPIVNKTLGPNHPISKVKAFCRRLVPFGNGSAMGWESFSEQDDSRAHGNMPPSFNSGSGQLAKLPPQHKGRAYSIFMDDLEA